MGDDYILGLGPNQGSGTMLTSTSSAPPAAGSFGADFAKGMSSWGGPLLMAMGAVQTAVGAYYQSQTAKYQLQSQQLGFEFNQKMADINARQMENQAQWYMLQGERQIGTLTMRAGKIRGSQRASQAARGIVAGVGSAAEEIATTDLMKETDAITINVNATRAANAARTQKVNFENSSLLAGVSANNSGSMASAVNPGYNAAASLLQGAGSVATSWYRSSKFDKYLAAAGY